jgi:outer membrane protein TolC
MLFSICLSTFGNAPTALSADPHPLVPPLACCTDSRCPCHTNTCVGLPCIPVCDPAVDGASAGPAWNLTLQEAINTAMSNSEAVRNLGLVEAASRNDIVRSVITTYDAMEAYALASGEWGIFDPLWTTEMIWDKQDIPPGTSFSGIGNRPPQLDTADFYTSLEQLLPMGTRLRATFATDYLFNPDKPAGLDPNPQYFSYNQWGITQPLLRGFGVDVTMAPIKIACAEAERTDWQFKQEMLAMVRSIETTYWALYAQQQNLKALDEALPAFREVVRLRQEQAGGAVGTESEVARAQSEMYLFEQRRLEVMSKIAENQLVLRNLMGLPPNDCRDIYLLAVPTTTRPTETLPCAVQRAINSRPDVLRQRLAVYIASQERLLADNALLPQLDLNGFWQTNGLGENLDESYESKDSNDFESWQMGVFFQIPLGRRQGRAELRAAELRMSRERTMLEQTAHQASYEVVDAYRRLNWTYQQLQIAANREQALNQWRQGARATFENPPPGMTTVFALELYLGNLRDITDASFSRNALLADYNSALARLDEVTGTLLENRMVQVAGDASDTLPSKLPPVEIQLPESVAPTPAQPAPQQPPQGMAAPPTAAPIASTPQPIQQAPPAIQMPESMQPAPNAYSSLPITPTPDAIAAPVFEPAPIVQTPPMEAPAMEQPAVEPPVAIAEQTPAAVPQMSQSPAIEMPQSTLPAPGRTAMRPERVELPAVEMPAVEAPMMAAPAMEEPIAAEPWIAEPQPIAKAPALEQPRDVTPMIEQPQTVAPQREIVREAPRRYEYHTQQGPTLAIPQSVMPAAPVEPVEAPRLSQPMTVGVAKTQAAPQAGVAAEPQRWSEPLPQARPSVSLQMPSSVWAAPPVPATRTQPQATSATPLQRQQQPTTAPMQFPESIRSSQAASVTSYPPVGAAGNPRAQARPMPSTRAMNRTPSQQAGPKLQLPGSVRPAAAELNVNQAAAAGYPATANSPVTGAALQFPSSVGPVVR